MTLRPIVAHTMARFVQAPTTDTARSFLFACRVNAASLPLSPLKRGLLNDVDLSPTAKHLEDIAKAYARALRGKVAA